jgi:hypothetical protein
MRTAVRRIFNNGSWQEGGRLFDGFWETMRREDRFKFLRICTAANPNCERIANVDFGQLFPTLAYRRASSDAPDAISTTLPAMARLATDGRPSWRSDR